MDVLRAALVSLFTMAAACSVGEVPIGGGTPDGGGGDGGGTGGGQTFDARVKPLVTECIACHGGTQAPNLASFAVLQATYKTKPGNTNILVTKGNLTGGVHSGLPYLTAAEQTTVAAWIDSL